MTRKRSGKKTQSQAEVIGFRPTPEAREALTRVKASGTVATMSEAVNHKPSRSHTAKAAQETP